MNALIKTDRLDHVHLNVQDRAASASWYSRVLGLRPIGNHNPADGHPLFLAPANGTHHCVSLFIGTPASGPNRNIAFHADAAGFLKFANSLPNADVIGHHGQPLAAKDRHDYGMAITFDFVDIDGNHIELVTYGHNEARKDLVALL